MANATTCSSSGLATDVSCQTFMANYCQTNEILGPTYKQKWQGDEVTSQCRRFVSLNAGNQPQYVPTTDGYVRKYLITEAHPITYAQQGSLVYDPAIEDVVSVCQNYPGACDAVLGQVCTGYTREDLANNPNLAKLCGCFMSDAEYDKYTGTFGIQKICDPACVLESAVKPRDPSNQFQTLHCAQTVCVIDDVTISILGKSSTGDINFSQACSSCGTGAGCTCNISDISITTVDSTLGNIDFSQQCGGNVNCFKRDANGIPRPVACSSLESGSSSSTTKGLSTTTILIIIGAIIALVVIIIIIAVLVKRNRQEPTLLRYPEQLAPPPPAWSQRPSGFNGSDTVLGQSPLF